VRGSLRDGNRNAPGRGLPHLLVGCGCREGGCHRSGPKRSTREGGNDQKMPLLDATGIDAWAVLQEQRVATPRTDRIFPYNGKSAGTAFRRACRELGIKNFHFHDPRPEAASRFFDAGFTTGGARSRTQGLEDASPLHELAARRSPPHSKTVEIGVRSDWKITSQTLIGTMVFAGSSRIRMHRRYLDFGQR
jgi:hypothetical protein